MDRLHQLPVRIGDRDLIAKAFWLGIIILHLRFGSHLCRLALDVEILRIDIHAGGAEIRVKRQRLVQLNSTLVELEKKIIIEAKRLVKQCEKRLKRPEENFLKDYEIEAMIKFVLDKDGPDYRDNDDNIIAELDEICINLEWETFANGENYNDTQFTEDRMYHCWLFHSLYGHTKPRLTFRDMLRIGDIWVDIVGWYQDFIRLDRNMKIVKD